MTLEEYGRINKLAEAKQTQQMYVESRFMRENADEIASKYLREQLKRRQPQPNQDEIKREEEIKESYETYEEPEENSSKAYGKWQTVAPK